MEEEDILDEMSADHSGSNQETTTTDDHSIHLPAWLAYLSLGFKVISTVIIVLMAGWVLITIKTTKNLKKIHNICVANLMATEILCALMTLLLTGTMMIGSFTGMGDFIGCNVFKFLLFPVSVINFTFLMISVDKVIAITFPLRYRQIMKPRVVFGIIITKWVLAVMLSIHNLFNSKGFTKVAKYGTCITNDGSVLQTLITFVLPTFLACILTVILNIYLTIKAYQVHKQIQEESKLSGGHSGDNDQLKALKKKHVTIKKHRKPLITLLVVVLGSTSVGLLFPLLFIATILLDSPPVYEAVMRYMVTPNIGLMSLLFHPFVYGLYFTQVREPMIRLLKRITSLCKCKSAAVAPQPQRRINWLNPN